jgi:hypothetical protein
LLGNLANRSNYRYSEADAAQIIRALEAELRLLKSKFADDGEGRGTSFRLEPK